MQLTISPETLRQFMSNDPDCEQLSEDEFIADLYDSEAPITADVKLNKDGAEIIAAAQLLYDKEQDGWYMGERIEDEARVARAFEDAIAKANG